MIRCPVCKAQNESGPQCRRCRADLSLLFAVEKHQVLLRTAAERWASLGEGEQVLALADQLEKVRRDEEVNRLRALGYLLQRDFAKAWQVYQKTIAVEKGNGSNTSRGQV